MATTPFLMALGRRFGGVQQSEDRDDLDGPGAASESNVVVVGHGRFGQVVAQIMAAAKLSVTLIDSNPDQIDVSREYGRKVYYGDGTRLDLLRLAGVDQAAALFFCLDGTALDTSALERIVEAFPNTRIFVRVYDRRHELALKGIEVDGIVREVFESAIVMAHQGMLAMELEDELVERVEEEFRDRDAKRMAAQHEAEDLHAGSEHSFGIAASRPMD
jgi:glutathione-regulated potassium-efflux system protein KefB